MPDHVISIKTSADTSGLKAIHAQLAAIRDLAAEISKHGVTFGGVAGGPAMSPAMASARAKIVENQARLHQTIRNRAGVSAARPGAAFQNPQFWNNFEIGEETYGAVIMQANQNMRGAAPNLGAGGGRQRSTRPTPNVSAAMSSAIAGINERLAGLQATRQYQTAMQQRFGWSGAQMQSQYGVNLVSDEEIARLEAERNRMSQAMGPAGGGSGSGAGGRPPRNPFLRGLAGGRGGGGAIGASWDAEGIAGAAGAMLSRFLPIAGPLALGSAAVGLGVSSFNKYMGSGTALSPLTKAVTTAGDSLEKFQNQVNTAGQALGYSASQVGQAVNILGAGLGHMGTGGIVGFANQSMGFSRAFGLSLPATAQAMTTAGRLGLIQIPGQTSPGALLTNPQLMMALSASSFMSGAQGGRMGDLMDELLQVSKQIENTAGILTNPIGALGVMTQMNKTLPQSMRYGGGAQLIGQLSQGIANPGGGAAGLMMGMRATGVTDYAEFSWLQDMGPFQTIPTGPKKGQMQIQAYLDYMKGNFGAGAKFGSDTTGYMPENHAAYVEALMMKNIYGIKGAGTGALNALNPSQWNDLRKALAASGLTRDQLAQLTPSQIIWAGSVAGITTQKGITSLAAQMTQYGANFSPELQKVLQSGNVSAEQKALEKYILKTPGLKPMSTVDTLNVAKATLNNAQISWAGGIGTGISDIVKALRGQPVNYGSSNTTQIYGGTKPANPGAPQMPSISVTRGLWQDIGKAWDWLLGGPPAAAATLPAGATQPIGNSPTGYYYGQNATPMIGLPNLYGKGNSGPVNGPGGGTGRTGTILPSGTVKPPYFAGAFAKAGVPGWLATGIENWEGGGSPSKISPDTGGTWSVGPLQLNSGGQAAGHSMAWWAAHPEAQAARGIPPIAAAYKQALSQGIPDKSEAMLAYVLGHSGHPGYNGVPASEQRHTDQVWQELASEMRDAAKEMKAAAQDLRTSARRTQSPHPLGGVNR